MGYEIIRFFMDWAAKNNWLMLILKTKVIKIY